MDLNTLQEEVDKDIKIKSDSLDIESLRIPEIQNGNTILENLQMKCIKKIPLILKF